MNPWAREHCGLRRAVIERLSPSVDHGRFPIKRTVGETIIVEADVFTDGHDRVCAVLRHRRRGEEHWHEQRMTELVNDRWQGVFRVQAIGEYDYSILAWVDGFTTWRADLTRRIEDEDIVLALHTGAALLDWAAHGAAGPDRERLNTFAAGLRDDALPLATRVHIAMENDLSRTMFSHADRSQAIATPEYRVTVERSIARRGAWYEFFPRSCGGFRDCEHMLDYVADLGFDIVYLPPIHPIGMSQRKGPNNVLAAGPDDPGSPWAIGSAAGGHKSVHPELGTLADFRAFMASANNRGLEVALDIAFQCSPDHPYVREHPSWFARRPDGSIRYAENPPKKYQDIYPLDFESADWEALWDELLSIFMFWAEQGVRIFRVDNPHTKPFPFWEWVLGEVRRHHPDAVFLSEAFTRPKLMHRLAKLGFSQSYTYFTWRNTKHELENLLQELMGSETREYFRPNLWPNTPDILNEYLQYGGRPAFIVRLVIAALASANYGIYGPAFELAEATPREPGSEEYLDSEKYQRRRWQLDKPASLRDLLRRINRIRREQAALHTDWNLRFHPIGNDQLCCFSKSTPDKSNTVVVVANLDPHHRQSGWLTLPLAELGMGAHDPYQMHDLLSGARFLWHGDRNYVELDPQSTPVHVFLVRRRLRSERDFAYYL